MPVSSIVADPAVVESAQSFVPRVAAAADEIEASRNLPADLIRDFRDAGLLRLFLPRAFGGSEATPFTVMGVAEVLAGADASTAWIVNVANQAAWLTSRVQPDAARGFLGPDTILFGSGTPSGRAEAVDRGYRLHGTFPFASGVAHATVVSAVTMPNADNPAQPTMFFLPRAECRVLDTWHTTGMRGTGSNDFEVDGAFVPAGHAVVPSSPPAHPGPLYRIPYVRFVGRGGLSLGVARKALDAFTELARTKKQLGSAVTLAAQERFQIGLAEAEAVYQSARWWLHAALAAVWEPVEAGQVAPYKQRAALGLATSHATQASLRVVQELYRLGGTSSSKSSWVLDRCLRDMLTAAADISIGPLIVAAAGRAYLEEGAESPWFEGRAAVDPPH